MFAVESLIAVALFSVVSNPKMMTKIAEVTGLRGMLLSTVAGFLFVFLLLMLIPILVPVAAGGSNEVKFLGSTNVRERKQWTGAGGTNAFF